MKERMVPTAAIHGSLRRSADVASSRPKPKAPARNRERSASRPVRILLAEDDDEMRKLLVWCLRDHGYEVAEARDGIELCKQLAPQLAHAGAGGYDLVISDIRMPGTSGLQVLEGLQALAELPPMILITAFGDEATHGKVRDLGSAVLDKPFELDDLLTLVAETLP